MEPRVELTLVCRSIDGSMNPIIRRDPLDTVHRRLSRPRTHLAEACGASTSVDEDQQRDRFAGVGALRRRPTAPVVFFQLSMGRPSLASAAMRRTDVFVSPTTMPRAADQIKASAQPTSFAAGFFGGGFPVDFLYAVSSAFLESMPAPKRQPARASFRIPDDMCGVPVYGRSEMPEIDAVRHTLNEIKGARTA